MNITLSDADHVLMDRYFRSVLIRFKDGDNDLMEATQELAQAFSQVARGDAGGESGLVPPGKFAEAISGRWRTRLHRLIAQVALDVAGDGPLASELRLDRGSLEEVSVRLGVELVGVLERPRLEVGFGDRTLFDERVRLCLLYTSDAADD